MNTSIVVHGDIMRSEFNAPSDSNTPSYFLFVSASTCLRLDGKIISAGSFPVQTALLTIPDPFSTPPGPRVVNFELVGLANQSQFPSFKKNPDITTFRILRLLDFFSVVSQDMQHFLSEVGFEGEASLAVTISGHIATDAEKVTPSTYTEPTITLEKLATFEAIQKRAFEIFQSGSKGCAEDNWFQAERELLAH